MGNMSSKGLGAEDEDAWVCFREESDQVVSYRRKTQTDAMLVYDPASDIQSYVPRMLDIDCSKIVGRRRALSELCDRSLVLASLNSRSREKRRTKKTASADKQVSRREPRPEPIPQVFQMEELSSPTLLKDLMEFDSTNSCSRLNY